MPSPKLGAALHRYVCSTEYAREVRLVTSLCAISPDAVRLAGVQEAGLPLEVLAAHGDIRAPILHVSSHAHGLITHSFS